MGITPARAGKRGVYFPEEVNSKDHPRVRGEKAMGKLEEYSGMGSPPRARGKVLTSGGFIEPEGITPACAGKSALVVQPSAPPEDHPRVRGEKRTI